MDQIFFFQRS